MQCYNHPNQQAVVQCIRCHSNLCTECILNNKDFCPLCGEKINSTATIHTSPAIKLERQITKTQSNNTKTRFNKYWYLLLLVIPLLFFFLVLFSSVLFILASNSNKGEYSEPIDLSKEKIENIARENNGKAIFNENDLTVEYFDNYPQKASTYINICKMFERLSETEHNKPIIIIGKSSFTDKYGSEVIKEFIIVKMSQNTLGKIHWDVINPLDLPDIADEFWIDVYVNPKSFLK